MHLLSRHTDECRELEDEGARERCPENEEAKVDRDIEGPDRDYIYILI